MYKIKRTAGLLVLLLTMDSAYAGLSASVSSALQKIRTTIPFTGNNYTFVPRLLDHITDYLRSNSSATADAVSSSIETIGGAVSSVTSDKTLEIVSGTLTMISAVTSLIPGAGPIVGTVFSLISTILSAVGGGSEDVGSIVKREIEKALNNYDDSQLRAEAAGTIRVYKNSNAYLSAREGNVTLSEHEVSALAANIPIYSGVTFLGILTQKVKDNTLSSDEQQVKRAMSYLQLYVTLAVMRSAILWQMYSLVRAAPHSDWTAAAIQRVAIAEEKTDKTFLNILIAPEYSRAIFFAYFNPSEWPVVMKFLEKNNLTFQNHVNLTSGSHTFRPEKWTNYYMYMAHTDVGHIGGETSLSDQSRFHFDAVSLADNVYHIRTVRWPDWWMYMVNQGQAYCRGWNGQPGPQGEWKVVQYSDGKYLLSTRQWPNWFIYMKDEAGGSVVGWNGDPGIQGHWLID